MFPPLNAKKGSKASLELQVSPRIPSNIKGRNEENSNEEGYQMPRSHRSMYKSMKANLSEIESQWERTSLGTAAKNSIKTARQSVDDILRGAKNNRRQLINLKSMAPTTDHESEEYDTDIGMSQKAKSTVSPYDRLKVSLKRK